MAKLPHHAPFYRFAPGSEMLDRSLARPLRGNPAVFGSKSKSLMSINLVGLSWPNSVWSLCRARLAKTLRTVGAKAGKRTSKVTLK